MLTAITTYANDSRKPKPVRMTKEALNTKQAQAVQKAWAKHLGMEVVVKNAVGMQLCVIPPGTYRLGSPKGEADRKPFEKLVEVTHSKAFLIGRYEVTQGEWEQVMGPIPNKRPRSVGKGVRFPVYHISHAEASEFCRKLTELDRKAGKLPEGYVYRLPTDAEWEYACRAGTLTATCFGNQLSSKQANFDGGRPYNGAEDGPNLGRTAEVGGYKPNAWGLYDMHGNLSEWCLDWYHAEVKGGVDPVQLQPSPKRLIRDGRWGYWGRYCRSANRYYAPPNAQSPTIGFRPVLTKLLVRP